MSDSLYGSFRFSVECETLDQFEKAKLLLDSNKLNNAICEYDYGGFGDDCGVAVKFDETALTGTFFSYNIQIKNEADDFINDLRKQLKKIDVELVGDIVYDSEGEHVVGDFSEGTDELEFESVDDFAGYTVKQLRELKRIAKEKWGKPQSW